MSVYVNVEEREGETAKKYPLLKKAYIEGTVVVLFVNETDGVCLYSESKYCAFGEYKDGWDEMIQEDWVVLSSSQVVKLVNL